MPVNQGVLLSSSGSKVDCRIVITPKGYKAMLKPAPQDFH